MRALFFNKIFILALAILLLGIGGFQWWRTGRPQWQVAKHQSALMSAVEDRNFEKLETLLADDFSNPYGHDKKWAMNQSRTVLKHFFVLTVEADAPIIVLGADEGSAEVTQSLVLRGSGTAVVPMVIEAVNGEQQPFLFRWERVGGGRDWQLKWVDHPAFKKASSASSYF